MYECILPAFPFGIDTGSGLNIKQKNALTFPYSPAHAKFILAPKLLTIKNSITDQRFFVDEARNAFLAVIGYTGLLFTSLNFLSESLPWDLEIQFLPT